MLPSDLRIVVMGKTEDMPRTITEEIQAMLPSALVETWPATRNIPEGPTGFNLCVLTNSTFEDGLTAVQIIEANPRPSFLIFVDGDTRSQFEGAGSNVHLVDKPATAMKLVAAILEAVPDEEFAATE